MSPKPFYLATLIATVLLMVACSNTREEETDVLETSTADWDESKIPHVGAFIARMSGEESINCGYYDFTTKDYPESELGKAEQCILASKMAGIPFRYAQKRTRAEKRIYQASVLSTTNILWLIEVSESDEAGNPSIELRKCNDIGFNPLYKTLFGSGCTRIATNS